MAAKDKNGPGNNKAYMPVPKGYKGNWNVPKGTPWKKDSPFNPANKNKGTTSGRVTSPVTKKPAMKKTDGIRMGAPTPKPVAPTDRTTSRVTKKPVMKKTDGIRFGPPTPKPVAPTDRTTSRVTKKPVMKKTAPKSTSGIRYGAQPSRKPTDRSSK